MVFKIIHMIPGVMSIVAFGLLTLGCLRLRNGITLKRCLSVRCVAAILALCIAFAGLFGFANYISEKDARWFTLNLNFENAAKGMNQNGTRFNYTSLITKDLLRDIIKEGKYSIDADDLYELVWISTAYDEKQPDTDNPMIATQYTIHLSGDIAKYNINADKLIKDIKDKCISNYLSTTTENSGVLSVDVDDISDYDYLDAANKLELEAGKMRDYINSYKWDKATFRTDDNETFASLSQKISDFIDVELDSYKSFIKEKGIAKDKNNYITTLQYRNKMLNTDKQKQDAIYNTRLDGIDIYDGDMARVVLVPTEDEDNEFYMSRTKIGVDYFSNEASDALSKSADLSQQITENKDIIKRLKNTSSATDEDFQKASSMLEKLSANLKTLSKTSISFFNTYIQDDQKGYIKVEIGEKRSLKTLADINCVIKYGSVFAIAVVIIMATKKEKKNVPKKTD